MAKGQHFHSLDGNILNLSGFPSRPDDSEVLGKRAVGVHGKVFGPVAQLGERLVCIQEVVGSNPVGSTNKGL